jgi:hypothetical protein
MAINSTEVSYAFGQMGSILHVNDDGTADAGITVNGELKARGAVFVAITFLEDSVFDGGAEGLIPVDTTLYISSTAIPSAIDANGGSAVDNVVFPKGLTIYGRWEKINLSSGKCIAYIGY